MADIDTIIHQPIRLRIMAAMMSLAKDERVDFSYLKKLLSATDGNLGTHLFKLEEAGYIEVEKTFVARKPRTFVIATPRGKAAFCDHVVALQEILNSSNPKRDT
jgi:DNA-binding MarR family transcriptional regulator